MTPMHRRMPSTLYIIVDTPLRAEERRVSGPPATGYVVICSSLDLYIPGFVLCIYANVMPRAVRVCSARMSRHSCAHGFVSSQVGENVRPCLDLVYSALSPCSGGRRRSLTTRVRFWTPQRPAPRQWDLVVWSGLVSM